MNRKDLEIPAPCQADWNGMEGDERERYCLSCQDHVHNLSEMTRREALDLLAQAKQKRSYLCVRYLHNEEGNVVFAPSRIQEQLKGLRTLLAAGALAFPFSASTACDTETTTPEPVIDLHEKTIQARLSANVIQILAEATFTVKPRDEHRDKYTENHAFLVLNLGRTYIAPHEMEAEKGTDLLNAVLSVSKSFESVYDD